MCHANCTAWRLGNVDAATCLEIAIVLRDVTANIHGRAYGGSNRDVRMCWKWESGGMFVQIVIIGGHPAEAFM